jgi:hypothetical protein
MLFGDFDLRQQRRVSGRHADAGAWQRRIGRGRSNGDVIVGGACVRQDKVAGIRRVWFQRNHVAGIL